MKENKSMQIECRDLLLGYDGQAILSPLTFTVCAGDYLCIVGENGAGKTTLMKTLLKLHQPVGGSIRSGEGFSRTDIGYLPQQSAFQRDFPASVQEIVLSGCQNRLQSRAFYNKEDRARAAQMMQRLGITKLKSRSYRELSGGQQQKVLLARALCAADRMLLLDEPVAGLDPNAAEEFYRIIEELNRKDHITIVMISHDVEEVLHYASHILELGNKIFFGTKEEYLQHARSRRLVYSYSFRRETV